MSRPSPLVIVVVGALVLTLAVAAWLFWPGTPAPSGPPEMAVAPPSDTAPPAVPAPASVPAAASAPASEPEAAPTEPVLPDTEEAVNEALTSTFGRKAVLSLLQTDGFSARVAATVDSLTRPHVAPRVWPLNPTAGRFSADEEGRIAAANAARYNAAVQMLDTVSPAQALALYRQLAPSIQAAYEQLGYPGQPFHGRLIEVVDHLLETPTITRSPAVTLTEVQGPIKSERPWVRYEFADPRLQSLSSGQRILLRIGPAHQKRVMTWLRELRALL